MTSKGAAERGMRRLECSPLLTMCKVKKKRLGICSEYAERERESSGPHVMYGARSEEATPDHSLSAAAAGN